MKLKIIGWAERADLNSEEFLRAQIDDSPWPFSSNPIAEDPRLEESIQVNPGVAILKKCTPPSITDTACRQNSNLSEELSRPECTDTRKQIAQSLFGKGMIQDSDEDLPPFAPWNGYIMGYDPNKTYPVADRETHEIVGTVGKTCNVERLKPGVIYDVIEEVNDG